MRHWILSLIFLFLASRLAAQPVDHENYSIEEFPTPVANYFALYLASAIPNPQFKKAMDSEYGAVSLGFDAGFGLNPYGKERISPLLLGIDFSYHTFGRDKTTDPVTDIRYKTSFNTYFVGPCARLYVGRIKKAAPFLEGYGGLSVLNARTKLDRTLLDNSEEEVLIGSENDAGFAYGLGFGIHGKAKGDNPEAAHASFSLRVLYTWGERAKHIVRNSVQVVDDVLSYQTGFTGTNMLQIQVGITLY